MSDLAKTACQRCREQKLRCSRERPKCSRCLRLGAACGYPPPPDRKMLAAFREPPRKRKAATGDLEKRPSKASRSQPLHSSPSSISTAQDTIETSVIGQELSANALGVPIEVQRLLHEIYFTCMFNSTLLFHRPTFTRAFDQALVPIPLLLAVQATATIFLTPESSITKRNSDVLNPLGDLKALGKQWAIRAGKETLQNIDQPDLNAVRTCQILAMYWFSKGESQRNTMFSGIAYKGARTIGLDTDEPVTAQNSINPTLQIGVQWLRLEMMRRCFWAVWFTQSVNSDHNSVGIAYNNRIMQTPLPISEQAYEKVVEEQSRTFSSEQRECEEQSTQSYQSNPSIMATLISLMLHWVKIRDHLAARESKSTSDWLAKLFQIESDLMKWSSTLPACFTYSRRNLYEEFIVNHQLVYPLMHALYFQCRLVLHCSLVPQFSGLALDHAVSSEVTSMSTQISLRMAQSISVLGSDLLALECDSTQIASFVGYCLYVSASIHITFLSSRDATLANLAKANLVSNLKLLKSMKQYWSNLQRLWTRIGLLYNSQKFKTPTVHQDTSSPTVSQAYLREIDEFAAEFREIDQLSEPLAHSILDYTLQRLKPHTQQETNADNKSNQFVEPGQPSQQIIQDTDSHHEKPTASEQMTHELQAGSIEQLSKDDLGGPSIFETVGNGDQMFMTPYFDFNNSDWWQFNPDGAQESFLLYEDIVGMNYHM